MGVVSRDRVTLSAVLIVKDEEEVLERCLSSVAWADEIVVYDTGSTDRTVEIARRFTETVVEGYWDEDFGAARNRALAHATSDWIMVVDADEVMVGDPESVLRRLAVGTANLYTPDGVPRTPPGGRPAASRLTVAICDRISAMRSVTAATGSNVLLRRLGDSVTR